MKKSSQKSSGSSKQTQEHYSSRSRSEAAKNEELAPQPPGLIESKNTGRILPGGTMERPGSGRRTKSSEDGGSSKESSRSSSKDKQGTSLTSKDQESEKSSSKQSHSKSSKTDSGSPTKIHHRSSTKSKDEKGKSSKSTEDIPKSSSSHKSSTKEDSKSKHKIDEGKQSESKSSHRSSKEKSESSKQSHRSSTKEEETSSSRHGHRSSRSEHKHSSSSSKAAVTDVPLKSKHSESLSLKDKDALKVSSRESRDISKSSRSHASHKDEKNVTQELLKRQEVVKGHSRPDSKDPEASLTKHSHHLPTAPVSEESGTSKHAHKSSSKSEKSSKDKDKSRKESKRSSSDSEKVTSSTERSSESSSFKELKSQDTSKRKHKSSKSSKEREKPQSSNSQHSKNKHSSQKPTLSEEEAKKHHRNKSKSKKSGEIQVENLAVTKHPDQSENPHRSKKSSASTRHKTSHRDKSSGSKGDLRSNIDPETQRTASDAIGSGSRNSTPANALGTEALRHSGNPLGVQEVIEVITLDGPPDSISRERVKRNLPSPSSTTGEDNSRNYKRLKLDVPEKLVHQYDGTTESAKVGVEKGSSSTISETGTKGDLYVSVKLSAIQRNAPGGKFQVEGLAHRAKNPNQPPMKRKVHFGNVQKIYIERRKKVRFAKVVATHKWPMSRKVKFVKLKKSSDSGKTVHKHEKSKTHKLSKPKSRRKPRKTAEVKFIKSSQGLPKLKVNPQKNTKVPKKKAKPTTKLAEAHVAPPSKGVPLNDPEKISENKSQTLQKDAIPQPTGSGKRPSFTDSIRTCKPVHKESKIKLKQKTEKILVSGQESKKTGQADKLCASDKIQIDHDKKSKVLPKSTYKSKNLVKGKQDYQKVIGQKKGNLGKIPSISSKTNPISRQKLIAIRRLKMERLKEAMLKKMHKRNLFLSQIKKLKNIIKIEKTIRRLTRSVNKFTKPKDLSKLEKEIKRLIKIKSILSTANKTFDANLRKTAAKQKKRGQRNISKKKKVTFNQLSSSSKKSKRNVKSVKANQAINAPSKAASLSTTVPKSSTDKTTNKGIGGSEAESPLKRKKKISKKKSSKKKKVNSSKKHLSKASTTTTKKKEKHLSNKTSSSQSKKVHRITYKTKDGKVGKTNSNKLPTKSWKSKKTCKELKRCIWKLHENYYKAKNISITRKEKPRKSTSCERKVAIKKGLVINLNKNIMKKKTELKKNQNSNILARNQFVTFAMNRKLRSVSYRKNSVQSPYFRYLLMRQYCQKMKNLDCAHFRMIHDTQNVSVIKARWENISEAKPVIKKKVTKKRLKPKPLTVLRSGYIECFQKSLNTKITTLKSVNEEIIPFHLNGETSVPLRKECTAITATRSNGFGYFYCPNQSSVKVLKRVRTSSKLTEMQILLVRKNVRVFQKIKKNSEKTGKESLVVPRKRFPYEKIKLSRGQESVLGIIKKAKYRLMAKNLKSQKINRFKEKSSFQDGQLIPLRRRYKLLANGQTKNTKQGNIAACKYFATSSNTKPGVRKSHVSKKKMPVLLRKIVMPSKRRVLYDKFIVSEKKPSHLLSRSLPKPDKSKRKAFGSSTVTDVKRKPSYSWFLRKKWFPGQKPRFFLRKKLAVVPKTPWILRRKKLFGQPAEIVLVKKRFAPEWVLLKSPFSNRKAKLVLRSSLLKKYGKIQSIQNKQLEQPNARNLKARKESLRKKKSTTKLVIRKKSVAGKNPRFIVRRERVPRDAQRRRKVLLHQAKPRILIRKRRLPEGKLRLTIFREPIPGKKGKILKTKVYEPGFKPKIFIQKRIGRHEKPKIILTSHIARSSNPWTGRIQNQIKCGIFAEKGKVTAQKPFPIIRKELVSGQVFRISRKSITSQSIQDSKPKLLVHNNNVNSNQKPCIILKHESSITKKIQYFISRESLIGQKSSFLIQQGNRSQIMTVKKLVNGREPEIILKKVLLSETKTLAYNSATNQFVPNIQTQTMSSGHVNIPSLPINNQSAFKRNDVQETFGRNTSLNKPPLLILKKPITAGQIPQVLIRKEFANKYKPIVVIKKSLPGQKPQIVVKKQFRETSSKPVQSGSKSLLKISHRSKRPRPKSKQHKAPKKRSKSFLKTFLKYKAAFRPTKNYYRRQTVTPSLRKKLKRKQKKKLPKKTFKIYTGRSRVAFRSLLKRGKRRRSLSKIARRRKLLRQQQKFAKCQNKNKMAKKKSRTYPTQFITVSNVGLPGRKPKLLISRKPVPGQNPSVSVLVKQTHRGQKPQITISRRMHGFFRVPRRFPKLIEKQKMSTTASQKKILVKSGKPSLVMRHRGKPQIVSNSYKLPNKRREFSRPVPSRGKDIRLLMLAHQNFQSQQNRKVSIGKNLPMPSATNKEATTAPKQLPGKSSPLKLNVTKPVQSRVNQEYKKVPPLTMQLSARPEQVLTSEYVTSSKRKFSAIVSPERDKRDPKKRRVGTERVTSNEPLKRIQIKLTPRMIRNLQAKSKPKTKRLHNYFPNLLTVVNRKLGSEYAKLTPKTTNADGKSGEKGSVFKVPKVPPPRRPDHVQSKDGPSGTYIAPRTSSVPHNSKRTVENPEKLVSRGAFNAPLIAKALQEKAAASGMQTNKDKPRVMPGRQNKVPMTTRRHPQFSNAPAPTPRRIPQPCSTISENWNLARNNQTTAPTARNNSDPISDFFRIDESPFFEPNAEADESVVPKVKRKNRPPSPQEPIPAIWATPRKPSFAKTTVASILAEIARKAAARFESSLMETDDNEDAKVPEGPKPPDVRENKDRNRFKSGTEDEKENCLMKLHPISSIFRGKRFSLKKTKPTSPTKSSKNQEPVKTTAEAIKNPPAPLSVDTTSRKSIFVPPDSSVHSPEGMNVESSPTGFNKTSRTDTLFTEQPLFTLRESDAEFFIDSNNGVESHFEKLFATIAPQKPKLIPVPAISPDVPLPPVIVPHRMSAVQRRERQFKQIQMTKIAVFVRKRAQKLTKRNRCTLKKLSHLYKRKPRPRFKKKTKRPIQKKNPVPKSPPSKKVVTKKKPNLKPATKDKEASKSPKPKPKKKPTEKVPSSKLTTVEPVKKKQLSTRRKVGTLKSILKKPSFGMKTKRKVAPMRSLPKGFVLKSILKRSRMYLSHPGTAREAMTAERRAEQLKAIANKKVASNSKLSAVSTGNDRKPVTCKHFKGIKIDKLTKRSKLKKKPLKRKRPPESPVKRSEPPTKKKVIEVITISSESEASFSPVACGSGSSVAGCSKDTPSSLPRIQATSTVFKVPAIPPAVSKIRQSVPYVSSGLPSSVASSTYIAPVLPSSSDLSLSGILSGSFKVPSSSAGEKQIAGSSKRVQSSSHSSKHKKHGTSPQCAEDADTNNSASNSPSSGYSGLTLAALLKSSEFPVAKDSDHFKNLKNNWSSSTPSSLPLVSENTLNSKPGSLEEILLPNPKPPVVISEVKRISVPTKAQLKQVPPQPTEVDKEKSTSPTNTANTARTHPKKSDSKKPKKKERKPKQVPVRKTMPMDPVKSALVKKRKAKEKIRLRKSPAVDKSKRSPAEKEIPIIDLTVEKNNKSSKSPPAKKRKITLPRSKLVVRKAIKAKPKSFCKHLLKSRKIRRQLKSIKSAMKKQRVQQKVKLQMKKPVKKVTFAKKVPNKTLANIKKKPKAPRFKIRYGRTHKPSFSRIRLRVLTSLYAKYEENMDKIDKSKKKNINERKTPTLENVCPNFLQEAEYIGKILQSKMFSRKLSSFRKKCSLGIRKIQMKKLHSKRSGSYSSVNIKLAQKVVSKYAANKILSRYTVENKNKGVTGKKSKPSGINRKLLGRTHKSSTPAKSQTNLKPKKRFSKTTQKSTQIYPNIGHPLPKKSKDEKKIPSEKLKVSAKQYIRKGGITVKSPRSINKRNIRTISKTSRLITKRPKGPTTIRKRREVANKRRLLKSHVKYSLFTDESHTASSTKIAKPFVVVSSKQIKKLNHLRRLIHTVENTGLVSDYSSFMVSSFPKPPPEKIIRTSELVARVPNNSYIMHSIALQRHKRELQDRIKHVKERGLAMRIGPMPKLPPIPKGFIEEEATPMTLESVETTVSQRICLSIAHGGFTHSTTNAVEALSYAVQQFYRDFCKNLKETVHRCNSHNVIGFPDPMDRVLSERGFGGVRGLEEYYNTEVIQRHKSLQNAAALKRVEYASILRAHLNLAPHTPITPNDFSSDNEMPTISRSVEPTGPLAEPPNISVDSAISKPSQLPCDRRILALIFDLEQDVLRTSPTVLSHEVVRPRFLEYQEIPDIPQKRLEVASVPLTKPVKKKEPKRIKSKHPRLGNVQTVGKDPRSEMVKKANENLAIQLHKTRRDLDNNKGLPCSNLPSRFGILFSRTETGILPIEEQKALLRDNLIGGLPREDQLLIVQWQRQIAGLKLSTSQRSPSSSAVIEKLIGLQTLAPEQTLFAKAMEIRGRLDLIFRDPKRTQAEKNGIYQSLDPKLLQFLRMAEIAKTQIQKEYRLKVLEAASRRSAAINAQQLALSGSGTVHPGNVKAPLHAALVQNTVPTPSSAIFPRAEPVPAQGLEKSQQKTTFSVKSASNIESQANSIKLTYVSQPAPSSKDFGQRITTPTVPIYSTPVGQQIRGKLFDQESQPATVVKNISPIKVVALASGAKLQSSNKTLQNQTVNLKTNNSVKQSVTSLAKKQKQVKALPSKPQRLTRKQLQRKLLCIKYSQGDRRIIKELRRCQLFMRISNFIQRLPKKTRGTALLRNPNLLRVLSSRRDLTRVIKGSKRYAKLVDSPSKSSVKFNPKSKMAQLFSRSKNQVKVFDHKTKSVKLAKLRRNQLKTRSSKSGRKKIITLAKNQRICKNPATAKKSIVTVGTEPLQIVNITKNKLQVVYPHSNTKRDVFMQPVQMTSASKSKSSTKSISRHEFRIIDPKRGDSKLISLARSRSLRKTDVVHKAPSNMVTVLDPATRQPKNIQLTNDQVAVIDPKTRKVKIRNLAPNQAKILDPTTKRIAIITLKPNQIKSYDEKSNTVRIINLNPHRVKTVDPLTKRTKTRNLKRSEVKVVNPNTKKVNIVNIRKLDSLQSHSSHMNKREKIVDYAKMNLGKKLTFGCKQQGIKPQPAKSVAPQPVGGSQKTSALNSSEDDPKLQTDDSVGSVYSQGGSNTGPPKSEPLQKEPPKDYKKRITERYLKTHKSSAPIMSPEVHASSICSSSVPTGPSRSTGIPRTRSNPIVESIDPKSGYNIRKPWVGETVTKPPQVLPTTSLLRPVNPNLPQFSKTSIIQVGSTTGQIPSRELPGIGKEIKHSAAAIVPGQKVQQTKSDAVSTKSSIASQYLQANLPTTKSQQKQGKVQSMPTLQVQSPKQDTYSQSRGFYLKSGGVIGSNPNLNLTPQQPLASRTPQAQDKSVSSTSQPLKVAYRISQSKMAPVHPHSSLTIISGGENPLIYDPSRQSQSPTKIAFSSSSALGRPVQVPSSSEPAYSISPTRESRKSDKTVDKSSSKTSSRHSESKEKLSKSSKSSSRSSESKSSRSTKDKDTKSSSKSSESKHSSTSSTSSSKSSSKHHASKHSSSSKSHKEPSPVPTKDKSKHHKTHEAVIAIPEPKQPAKRGRPPKRPAPVTPPKKSKSSSHSTPESAEPSSSSRKHAKYH